MKNYITILFTFIFFNIFSQGVAINTDGSNPDATSILDVKSTSKGILIPRMSQSERNSISSPTTSLMIYQTDNTPGFYYYNGSSWVKWSTITESTYTPGTGIGISNNTISITDVGTAGTYGSTTQVPIITTDGQGRITSVTNTTITGVAPSAGSSNYIQNGTTSQTADYNISGNGTVADINVNGSDVNGPGINGGTSGILRINSNTDVRVVLDKDANGSQSFDVAPNGGSTAVFSVTEAGNVTTNGYVRMLEGGATPTLYTTLQSGDLSSNLTLTLPTSAGTSGQVLQTDGTGVTSWTTKADKFVIPFSNGGGTASLGTSLWYTQTDQRTWISTGQGTSPDRSGLAVPVQGCFTFMATQACTLSRFTFWISNNTSNKIYAYAVYKYPITSDATTLGTGTVLISSTNVTVSPTVALGMTKVDVVGSSTVINAGEVIMIMFKSSSTTNQTVYINGTMEFTNQ